MTAVGCFIIGLIAEQLELEGYRFFQVCQTGKEMIAQLALKLIVTYLYRFFHNRFIP